MRAQPLDIYVMLDRSFSMDEPTGSATKWAAVTSALSTFVGQTMEDTSVGLQYFPQQDGSSWSGNDCRASAYSTPEVEIGPLAQTASQIRASMTRQDRQSGTPTSAALQGAIDHARAWASSHAGHAVVAILATDGDPTTCDTNLSHVNAIAASGVSGSPSVRTFVIGVGDLQANLDGIAQAGGTGAAFIVDTSGSVSSQFLEALNQIRGKAVACTYAIPPPPAGQTLDFTKVNVAYQRGGVGAVVTFTQVKTAADCGAATTAWRYDDNTAPASIILCPSTCSTVTGDAAASVKIVLGCSSQHDGEW